MLAAMLGLCSCVYDEPYRPDGGKGAGMVNLVLRVGINNSPSRGETRAGGEYPDGYPYEFEPAATVYEGINTLRVIIVDANKRVEHNRVRDFEDRLPAVDEIYGEMEFGVKGGEVKRVYLIANEASISPAIDFSQWGAGSTLLDETAEKWEIFKPWGIAKTASPYINNEGPAKSYIPMSEFFDIDIQEASADEAVTVTQSETLFITRSLVKFSFYLSASEDIPESFRISEIEFDNVMQKAFLLPNETVYSPAKMPLTDNFRRIVTSFNTPGFADNKVLPITFRPTDFGLNSKAESTTYRDSYIPQLYYCETKNNNTGNKFSLKLTVLWGDGEKTTYEDVTLPNLPSFPRNTHVKVYLTFADRKIIGAVDVVPYIGVDLKPTFGFEDLIIGEHRPSTSK